MKVTSGISDIPAGIDTTLRNPGHHAAEEDDLGPVLVKPSLCPIEAPRGEPQQPSVAQDQRPPAVATQRVEDERAGRRPRGRCHEGADGAHLALRDEEAGERQDHLGRDRREQVLREHEREQHGKTAAAEDVLDPLTHAPET
jgi:hypothetical protein